MVTITDRDLIEPGPREVAVREFAAAAAAVLRAISARIAVVRSASGVWCVATAESEIETGATAVPIQVFRGETATTPGLIERIEWAVREVLRQVVGGAVL